MTYLPQSQNVTESVTNDDQANDLVLGPDTRPCHPAFEGGTGWVKFEIDDLNTRLALDGKPMDFVDEAGVQWVMCACGHRAGGSPKPGDRIALCSNCRFLNRFKNIPVIYPERLPENVKAVKK